MKRLALGLVFTLSSFGIGYAGEPIKALVLDSGSDFTHEVLAPHALPNIAEANGIQGLDDDNNGYIDDVYGWNFVENNNVLVDLTSTPPDYDHILYLMKLLGILQAEGKEALTAAEFKELVTAYNDKKVWAWVSFTGGWAHGTHCAGIMSENNPNLKLNAIRHIPTGAAPQQLAHDALLNIKAMLLHRETAVTEGSGENDNASAGKKVTLEQLEQLFTQLGQQYAAGVAEKAAYLGSFKPRVVNCSFGSENKALCAAFKKNMIAEWGWTNPTDEEVQQVVNLFVSKALLQKDLALFSHCKDALFCIAAGNSSEDLDDIVTSPNDVPIENKLVVAATDHNRKLAAFSCHGTTKVDVAVPGVNIFSTYPNGKMGFMSGTSMACPMAARFATQVLEANDALSPIELKRILMGTVDKKDWLADKVRSGGVINPNRAIRAAELVKAGKTIEEAIAEAHLEVPDVAVRRSRFKGPDLNDKQVRDIYFSGVF
ncbi:MAG: hypothetical protein Kow0029_04510 [Candidatus Rifleibacteriota bacterium]